MKPEIGMYYSMCCLLDLYQIQTSEDLKYVESWLEDEEEEEVGVMIFPDLDSAFKALSEGFEPDEAKRIYDSIKKKERRAHGD